MTESDPYAEGKIRIFRRDPLSRVLGPYARAVIWVQGCSIGCPGCIVPESWKPEGEDEVSVNDLVAWVLQCEGIEGLTLSGGEPMQQAAPLVALIDSVRRHSDFGIMCYTGYRQEWLVGNGIPAQLQLLKRIDLLVDGPYVERLHGDFLWRASSNQRILHLSDRYRDVVPTAGSEGDAGAGLELKVGAKGGFTFTGVPPVIGFREKLEAQFARRGLLLDWEGKGE